MIKGEFVKKIRKRLTYANVMSSIAVFLVLGGATALAAGLAKNSVGSKQIKKNAVTAAKIKKNAVTTAKIKNDAVNGAKVNEGTLGTVPSANSANSANTAKSASSAAVASSLTPLEATHLVGAPGEPGFENGSQNLPVEGSPISFNPVGFYKDHEGIVHLQGIAKVGNGATVDSVFTLPPGFRTAPGKLIQLQPIDETSTLIIGGNFVIEGIDLSGKVVGEGEKPLVLDGITYRAES
jgi:hypothetical protein